MSTGNLNVKTGDDVTLLAGREPSQIGKVENATASDGARIQCAKCPWKNRVNADEIPNGYSRARHRALSCTIAEPGELAPGALRMMACHESEIGAERPCVGWLANQLGEGNNIGLRLKVLTDRSLADFNLVGPQHRRLENTIPVRKRRRTA